MQVSKPKQSASGGTKAGYSFLSSFDCLRYGYFANVCRLQRADQPPTTLLGAALHFWMQAFYSGQQADLEALIRSQPYPDDEALQKDLDRGKRVLAEWCKRWAEHDRAKLKVLAVEQEYQADVGDGIILTIKVDRVVEEQLTGLVLAQDTKFSGSLRPQTKYEHLAATDQATAYIAILRQVFPNFLGWQPDILYTKGSVVACERPGVIYRTADEVDMWLEGYKARTADIADRLGALERGEAPPHVLLPRNDALCTRFFRPCEYTEICRQRILPGEVPDGYQNKETD